MTVRLPLKRFGRGATISSLLMALWLVAAAWPTAGQAAAGDASPETLRCFGAASRDPSHPCTNPALRTAVFPTPHTAAVEVDPRCTNVVETDLWWICAMGAPVAEARGTFVLLGDSHAGHLRPAVGAFARAAGVRASSITRSGCPFSAGIPDLAAPRQRACVRWRRHVVRWLTTHPEVTTVFVSAHAGAGLRLERGRSQFAAKVDAYAQAWRALPASVTRIVAIRDVPTSPKATRACVERAIANRTAPEPACATPRSVALKPDAAFTAAVRSDSRRVQAIDLTRYFCGPSACHSVIGGALVHKDTGHLTVEYAASLAPAFTREVGALAPRLAFPTPAVERLGFAGSARLAPDATHDRVRFRVELQPPAPWRLAFRDSESSLARVTFTSAATCRDVIALAIHGDRIAASSTAARRLESVRPADAQPNAAGRTVARSGARADWGTWTSPATQVVSGAWIVAVGAKADADRDAVRVTVDATPSGPCPAGDPSRVERVAQLLRTLRLDVVR